MTCAGVGCLHCKIPHLDTKLENHQGGRRFIGVAAIRSTHSRKKGRHLDGIPDVIQSATSSSLFVVQACTLPNFLDQWRKITSNRFVLNIVKGHHLQLSYHPPLFCNFKWFNIKAVSSHHPEGGGWTVSQGCYWTIDWWCCFNLNVFFVPWTYGGLQPLLSLKQFNCYMHIHTFKILTIRHIWQIIPQGNYAFSIDLKDAYLHIPIGKHHCQFSQFICQHKPYWRNLLPFVVITAPQVFTSLINPYCFFANAGVFNVIDLDDIFVLTWAKFAGKKTWTFLCSLLVLSWKIY